MNWTTVNFGKYKGMSLPQIIFKDADWFFYIYENGPFKGVLSNEARELYRRARAIKVPQKNGQKMLVQYIIQNGKFGTIQLIPENSGFEGHEVASLIDFYVPKSRGIYDKKGYKNFVFSLKAILFGNPTRRMNRAACEAFFNDDNNFDLN
jgi:hypothetical protein